MADKLFHDLVTLFVVVNPIGVVPLFIAVAGHESAAARRRIAGQAILISTVILFVFIGIGQIVLEALGILSEPPAQRSALENCAHKSQAPPLKWLGI